MQQTTCEPPFPDVQMQLKTYFYVPFGLPCMHRNYGVISGSHACRVCVRHIILNAELYTTCPGERVLEATRFNATFLPLRLCYENLRTCFLKDAENLTTCMGVRRIFSRGGKSIFCFSFLDCWRCNANGRTQKQNVHVQCYCNSWKQCLPCKKTLH